MCLFQRRKAVFNRSILKKTLVYYLYIMQKTVNDHDGYFFPYKTMMFMIIICKMKEQGTLAEGKMLLWQFKD